MIDRVLVLPTPRALLPPISAEDPVADLRSAATAAVRDLLRAGASRLFVVSGAVHEGSREHGVTEALGHRVARHLLDAAEVPTPPAQEVVASADAVALLRTVEVPSAMLVMADGSARRHERAPGHLHPGAHDFDARIDKALREGDAGTLAGLDPAEADQLWCRGVPAFHVLAGVAHDRKVRASVSYADAPYGVAWWVATWTLG